MVSTYAIRFLMRLHDLFCAIFILFCSILFYFVGASCWAGYGDLGIRSVIQHKVYDETSFLHGSAECL